MNIFENGDNMKKILSILALLSLTGCNDKPGTAECTILGKEFTFEVMDYWVRDGDEARLILYRSGSMSIPDTYITIHPSSSCRFIPKMEKNK